jgi:hypothetical protein
VRASSDLDSRRRCHLAHPNSAPVVTRAKGLTLAGVLILQPPADVSLLKPAAARAADLNAVTPRGIRTPNRQIRRLVLYVHAVSLSAVCAAQGQGSNPARPPESCLVLAGGLTPGLIRRNNLLGGILRQQRRGETRIAMVSLHRHRRGSIPPSLLSSALRPRIQIAIRRSVSNSASRTWALALTSRWNARARCSCARASA